MTIATLNDIYDITGAIDRPAIFKYKRDGRWVDTTVPEFRDTVRYLATALRHAGVKPGDRVAILSENRPEWAISDFAILANQAVTVPVYPTLLGWQIEGSDGTPLDLRGADLRDAHLEHSKLIGAKLTGADLTGAQLTGADRSLAKFTDAKVTDELFLRILNRPATPTSVQNIAVQIVLGGAVKDELNLVRAPAQWYTTIPALTGLVLNKNETPFAPLYWDRYVQIKRQAR